MKSIVTKTMTAKMSMNGILELNYFNDVFIEESEMVDNIEAINMLCNNSPFKMLVVLNEFTFTSIDAKIILIEYTRKIKHLLIAEAIVVKSMQARLIENYYTLQNKDFYLIRIFNEKNKAKKWLSEIEDKKEWNSRSTNRKPYIVA
jgi:hypothetical protein